MRFLCGARVQSCWALSDESLRPKLAGRFVIFYVLWLVFQEEEGGPENKQSEQLPPALLHVTGHTVTALFRNHVGIPYQAKLAL